MIKTYILSLAAVLLMGVQAAWAGQNTDAELFDQGVALYGAKEYQQAEAAFEAVLKQNPYHVEAMSYLKKTAAKIGANEKALQQTVRAQALADVETAWNNIPLANETAIEDQAAVDQADAGQEAVEQMKARLEGLNIDFLDLKNASLKDTVYLLTDKSRRIDPAGKGVNVVLFGGDSSLAGESSVTFSIRNMSMYEALEYIAEIGSLTMDIRAKAVVLMPIGFAPVAGLKLVSYTVIPEVGEELEAVAGDAGGVEDLFGDASSETAGGPVNVEAFFLGTEWPEGASAVYEPGFHKLFVKNTEKNIEILESMLKELEEKAIRQRAQQVEIEAKFVEFSEGALEEIGFDWNVYGSKINSELAMKEGTRMYKYGSWPVDNPNINGDVIFDAQVPLPDNLDQFNPDPAAYVYTSLENGYLELPAPRNSDGVTRGQNVFGNYQRSNRSAFDNVASGIISTMGGVPASMLFGGEDFDLKISAMEQQGTADVLSAPKVTAKSGTPAVIKVGEAHRYPQDWQVDTGRAQTPSVTPQDWEDIYLGVVLEVTALVDAENNTIEMTLEPDIRTLKGFDTYVVTSTTTPSAATGASAVPVLGIDLPVVMPYYESRMMTTEVVIADGETVVMGGMVDERTETFRDQVPFLGDIPILGRFFRTEGTRNAKKNLTIFVTATQVDEYGLNRKQREALRQMADN